MQEMNNCEGIAYPSITADLQDINYAITPAIAENKLIPTDVVVIRVLEINKKKLLFKVILESSRIGKEGFIEYKNGHVVDNKFIKKWNVSNSFRKPRQ